MLEFQASLKAGTLMQLHTAADETQGRGGMTLKEGGRYSGCSTSRAAAQPGWCCRGRTAIAQAGCPRHSQTSLALSLSLSSPLAHPVSLLIHSSNYPSSAFSSVPAEPALYLIHASNCPKLYHSQQLPTALAAAGMLQGPLPMIGSAHCCFYLPQKGTSSLFL